MRSSVDFSAGIGGGGGGERSGRRSPVQKAATGVLEWWRREGQLHRYSMRKGMCREAGVGAPGRIYVGASQRRAGRKEERKKERERERTMGEVGKPEGKCLRLVRCWITACIAGFKSRRSERGSSVFGLLKAASRPALFGHPNILIEILYAIVSHPISATIFARVDNVVPNVCID